MPASFPISLIKGALPKPPCKQNAPVHLGLTAAVRNLQGESCCKTSILSFSLPGHIFVVTDVTVATVFWCHRHENEHNIANYNFFFYTDALITV